MKTLGLVCTWGLRVLSFILVAHIALDAQPAQAQEIHPETNDLMVQARDFTKPGFREKYAALRQADGGEITVYYDTIENGRLTGGVVTLDLPDLPPPDTEAPATSWNVTTLINNGSVSNRIDLVFLGDGYTDTELGNYATHVQNVINLFLAQEPLAAYETYFNVYQVDVISNESGVDEPVKDIYRDTALDMAYDCGGIARLLCIDVGKAFAAADSAPDNDQILALANSTRYGGAGYSGLSTLAGNNGSAVEIALHEFGHSFAGLADEYYYADGTTYTGPEPSQPNISIHDAGEQTSLQTKWYRWLDLTGVDTYEGAYYKQYGIYRPTYNSKMRSLGSPFGQVNVEQIIINFYQLVNPIDDASSSSPTPIPSNTTFYVTPLEPTDHALDIQWSIDGEDVPGATAPTFLPQTVSLTPGIHDLAVTVVDNTARVRDEQTRTDWMTDTRSWQIEVIDLVGDLDYDWDVDLLDLSMFCTQYLKNNGNSVSPADFNTDETVNLVDFTIMANYWLDEH